MSAPIPIKWLVNLTKDNQVGAFVIPAYNLVIRPVNRCTYKMMWPVYKEKIHPGLIRQVMEQGGRITQIGGGIVMMSWCIDRLPCLALLIITASPIKLVTPGFFWFLLFRDRYSGGGFRARYFGCRSSSRFDQGLFGWRTGRLRMWPDCSRSFAWRIPMGRLFGQCPFRY